LTWARPVFDSQESNGFAKSQKGKKKTEEKRLEDREKSNGRTSGTSERGVMWRKKRGITPKGEAKRTLLTIGASQSSERVT